MYFICSPNFY